MRSLRRRVKAAAHRLGYDIVRAERPPAESPFDLRRQRMLERLDIDLVFDIGANVGQYATTLRRTGYRGRIISAEPLSSAFELLKSAAKGDAAWDCTNVALGAHRGTSVLNISGYSESSSLLPMNDSHTDALPASAYIGSESVAMTTVDHIAEPVLTETSRAWLKLDVQGYEEPVLTGATTTLPRMCAVECELSLVELYAGQALLCDIVELLGQHSFRPVSLEPAFSDPTTGDTLQLNGLFVRSDAAG